MIRPTHAILNAQGEIEQEVFPEGCDPATLVELPADHWDSLDLELARHNAWHRVKAKRDLVHHGGAVTPLGRVDTSEAAKLNISGTVQMAMLSMQAGQPFLVEWTMADNTRVPHDAAQMLALGIAVGKHVTAAHAVAASLREALDAAQSRDEVEAIDVEAAPWPGFEETAPEEGTDPA